MAALRKNFLEQLPEMTREALAAFARSTERPEAPELLDDARRRLHTMAGTLGTFGYLDLMRDVRMLEECVAPGEGATKGNGASLAASLGTKIERLVRTPERPRSETL